MLPPQPPRVFSIRGLRLYFPVLESWVAWSVSLPAIHPGLSVCKCGVAGSASARIACAVPHSTSLGPATATRVLSTPVPVSAPPAGLDECLFFISFVSDPLAV